MTGSPKPVADDTRRPTILVAEDEVLLRVVLADDLRSRGYIVVEAANGDEALALLRAGIGVDVVVTDMRMPGSLDGPALARTVRTEFPLLKLVMVSGQTPDASVYGYLDAFLSKPFDVDVLEKRVAALLSDTG